jgi:hypothetical protein
MGYTIASATTEDILSWLDESEHEIVADQCMVYAYAIIEIKSLLQEAKGGEVSIQALISAIEAIEI